MSDYYRVVDQNPLGGNALRSPGSALHDLSGQNDQHGHLVPKPPSCLQQDPPQHHLGHLQRPGPVGDTATKNFR